MSDIFISYASSDRDKVKRLADALAAKDWSVWWDRTIPPGRTFDEVIEEALDAARCVVVLWSKASVSSTWVKTEAAEGARRRILIPALLEPVRIPLEFRRIQAADLSNWHGETSHLELDKLFESIRGCLRGPLELISTKVPVQPPQGPWSRFIRYLKAHSLLIAGALTVIVMVIGVLAIRDWFWVHPPRLNRPPRFIEVFPKDQRLVADSGKAVFRVTAQDPDKPEKDQLAYSWTLNDKPLAETSNNLTLTDLQSGSFQVKAVARDSVGDKVEHTWNLEVPTKVIPPIPPLEVIPPAKQITLKACETQTFLVKEGASLTRYAWWVDSQRQGEKGVHLIFSRHQSGKHEVRLTAVRDGETVSHTWEVGVTPAPPSEEEVQQWIEAYRRALEQKDVRKLRELGYVRSDQEAKDLQETLQARQQYQVHRQGLRVEAEGSKVRLRFDRMDRWYDAASYSMVVDRSPHRETLIRQNCTQVVAANGE
jgi:TIR domain